MKTYKNHDLGFEIDTPDDWSHPTSLSSDCILINHTPTENLNICVLPLRPERLLEYTELEFRQYALQKKYTDLGFGRIIVGEKEHVWVRYCMTLQMYTKKYMLVFDGIEYAITAVCTNEALKVKAEKVWDKVAKSFRLSQWRKENLETHDEIRKRVAGELFSKGYEAASKGNYAEACKFLVQCLDNNPDHILAHKELAFILKNFGDTKQALHHRLKVKQLDPSDKVNSFNLAGIYAMLGEREKALSEIDELIKKEPNNSYFKMFRKQITAFKS